MVGPHAHPAAGLLPRRVGVHCSKARREGIGRKEAGNVQAVGIREDELRDARSVQGAHGAQNVLIHRQLRRSSGNGARGYALRVQQRQRLVHEDRPLRSRSAARPDERCSLWVKMLGDPGVRISGDEQAVVEIPHYRHL